MFKFPKLKSDCLYKLAKALTIFGKPSQRLSRVLGSSLKLLESSLRKPKHSLSFLHGPQVDTTVLYKYEALPLKNIITFTSLKLSQSEIRPKT